MHQYSNITGRTKERKERMRLNRIEEIKKQIRITLMQIGATSNKESEEELLKKLEKLEAFKKILK
jgi:hypothetical protein